MRPPTAGHHFLFWLMPVASYWVRPRPDDSGTQQHQFSFGDGDFFSHVTVAVHTARQGNRFSLPLSIWWIHFFHVLRGWRPFHRRVFFLSNRRFFFFFFFPSLDSVRLNIGLISSSLTRCYITPFFSDTLSNGDFFPAFLALTHCCLDFPPT